VDLNILTERKYKAFAEDPIVQEIVGAQDPDHIELLKGFDKSTLYAIIVVHSGSFATKLMAVALHEAIRTANDDNVRKKPIYFVKNEGDILPTPDEKRLNREWATWDPMEVFKEDREKGRMQPLEGNAANDTKHYTVNAQTFLNLEELMNGVFLQTNSEYSRRSKKQILQQRACDVGSCLVS